MQDDFQHGFTGLKDGTQTTKNSRADEPGAYSALQAGPVILPDQLRRIWSSHQTVGCHLPLRYVASESPGQGGMAMRMNRKSTSDTFRY